MSVNGEHSLNDDHPSIDAAITYVKQEFKNILSKRKDLIKKLGEALESTVSNSESICEEIKSIIQEEIAQGLISRRDIERALLNGRERPSLKRTTICRSLKEVDK